jgi:hypothetical protein
VGIGTLIMGTLGSTTYFPLDLGIVEDQGLEVKYVVGGVKDLCFVFFLDISFSEFVIGVVFLGSGCALVFFFPNAKIEKCGISR